MHFCTAVALNTGLYPLRIFDPAVDSTPLTQIESLIVIALRKKNPEGAEEAYSYVYNPIATTRLDPGDIMIVLGSPDQIQQLRSFVNP